MPITLDGTTGIDAPLGTAATPSYGNTTATTTGLYFPTSTTLGLSTNGTAALTIDASQNVGVGTASPTNKFVISTSTQFKGLAINNGTNDIVQLIGQNAGNDAGTVVLLNAGTAGVSIKASGTSYLNGGNVGIGTTSPAQKLDVNGIAQLSGDLYLNNSTQYKVIGFYTSGTRKANIAWDEVNNWLNLAAEAASSQLLLKTVNTERMRITANGGVSFGSSGTAYGTSGQYLKSNGDAPPSWATLSATGALIRAPRVLTSGTSYTTPSNCTAIYVEVVGAGGGGGGTGGTSQSNGAGGGGGGYSAKYFTVTGSTAYSYAIGAGGSGGVFPSDGSTGGSSTFTVGATTITSTGGGGGTSVNTGTGSQGPGGAGGSGSNGDLNSTGWAGMLRVGGAGGSAGGGSFFGGGGAMQTTSNNNGNNGTQGGGGGGAYSSSAARTGGTGGAGVIRIWEFT